MKHAAVFILVFGLLAARSGGAQNAPPTGPAAANDAAADPQKAEIVREIIAVTGAGDLLKQVIDSMLPKSMAMLRQNPIYPAAFVDEAQQKMEERLKAIDFAEIAVPIFSKNFTAEELRQILAFDQTPTGKKVARLQPAILAEVSADAQARGRQIGMDVSREILAEHPEYARQIEENQRKTQSSPTPAAPHPDGSVYPIGNGVAAPQLIEKQEPKYTQQAIDAKFNGAVLLSIVVDETGVPRDIRVVRPVGLGLDEKAVEAVQTWRFKPATKDGKAVATHAQVQVNFHLRQNPQLAN